MPDDQPTRRGPRLSLRWKITLWMVLLYLVVQLSLVLILQLYQRRSINEFFDARIVARLEQFVEDLRPQLDTLSDGELAQIADRYRRVMLQRHVVVDVFDSQGEPVATSRRPRARLPDEVWEHVRQPGPARAVSLPAGSFKFTDSAGVRAAAGWVTDDAGRRCLVVLSWSDIYADEMLGLLSGAVFITVPIGLISVLVSAYAIAGIAVQPIRAMREMARALEPESIGQHVPPSTGGRELAGLRADLEATRQRLESAFAAQERFMSNVSHELKTPIAAMMTEAQTIKLDQCPPDVRAFVASSIEEMDKLGRMVDSFLLLTRVRHGKATIPDSELCTVRDIVAASFEGCTRMASQHEVRLSVRLPEGEDLDVAVLGNCDLLRTVIDNLVRNAVRFTPRGGVVLLTAAVREEHLVITVRDAGPGIPSELLPRIFDRFSQSKDELRRGRGHGLGLEIAMGITELHGGTIVARNLDTGGCEFEVVLPVARSRTGGPDTVQVG